MLRGKINLTLIPASSKQKKKELFQIWVTFSEVFFSLCLLILGLHLLLHSNISVSSVQFVDTDVHFIHSIQMQVLNWKMQMLWVIGKWRFLYVRPSWHSRPEYRLHRFHSNAEHTGTWFLFLKQKELHIYLRNFQNSPYLRVGFFSHWKKM